ncbi:cytochrome o ubiquinol oxidase subunit IV [Luteimonas sp. 3794]|uniref:cytochrome o ubiquinol oxidase subunit IV n=1 Tax=Luteimonas sp. 3794 TaxID=2817730 RepID=UPI00285FE656|nr:cytochrome o ubiquinol oxidase subunit IV [Luteimonas sp. 3794]MDR6992559.1 cytochrome o ubiquinol oxidase operon protein cyoD [Luteimonas sp. 3794]
MSTNTNTPAQHHPAHESAHDAHGHGSMRDYVIGFVLSVILTLIPFWLVMGEVLESRVWTVALIMLFGAVQIVVHMVYFLHMNRKSEGGWILMSLLFTGIIIVIALVGSLWVMHHLEANMMPMSPEQMRVAP